MSDLKKYIAKRKASSPEFAEGFDEGYENFRIGILLKQARLEAGLTQDEIASAIGTRKTAISVMTGSSPTARVPALTA